MPDPVDPPTTCEQGCIDIHKTATDAAWAAWLASDKGPAAVAAYLNACTAALAALNGCLENCSSGPTSP